LDRRALAKMRGKLAASDRSRSWPEPARAVRPKRSLRIWPFVIALGLALAVMEIALWTRDRGHPGPDGAGQASRLAPPPGLSLDEQARFWCYAAYDYPKLKFRYKLPKGVVIDAAAARANLERLLAEDIGNAVRNEVFAYQQEHSGQQTHPGQRTAPGPGASKPVAKARPDPAAKRR
jgi:hypothetical protein